MRTNECDKPFIYLNVFRVSVESQSRSPPRVPPVRLGLCVDAFVIKARPNRLSRVDVRHSTRWTRDEHRQIGYRPARSTEARRVSGQKRPRHSSLDFLLPLSYDFQAGLLSLTSQPGASSHPTLGSSY